MTKGALTRSAARGSSGGTSPVATACPCAWSLSRARCPAACAQHHTARGLTEPPLYPPSNRAAVAHGTKTASAQPRAWSSPLVR